MSRSAPSQTKESIFGLDFWAGSEDEAQRTVRRWLQERRYFNVAFANPEFLLEAADKPHLKAYLQQCRAVFADGIGIVWASRVQRGVLTQRITGTDFQWRIFELAAALGLRIFLYGARQGVAELAALEIARRYPTVGTVGCCDGYVPQSVALERIVAFKPDIVMVCLGNPRQEDWIRAYGAQTGARMVFGNGGALDFVAGAVQRAPLWMRSYGIEWLWRLSQDFSWTRIRRQARLVRFVGWLIALAIKGAR